MEWQKYFELSVKEVQTDEIFFKAHLSPEDNFKFEDLIISRFNHFRLSEFDKKKLSLDMRKIILGHQIFDSPDFYKICNKFKRRIESCPQKELVFSTQGGGIYLFIQMLKTANLKDKKIICYTSELPLPIMQAKRKSNIQFIYHPKSQSFLSEITSLWSESEIVSLFELKDLKASA